MFVSLVTIIVAMYIGMWIFVGVTPHITINATKEHIGEKCTVTFNADNGNDISGVYTGQNDQWVFLEDATTKKPVWIPLDQILVVRFVDK
jgi:hypothetical protein